MIIVNDCLEFPRHPYLSQKEKMIQHLTNATGVQYELFLFFFSVVSVSSSSFPPPQETSFVLFYLVGSYCVPIPFFNE